MKICHKLVRVLPLSAACKLVIYDEGRIDAQGNLSLCQECG